MTKSQGWERAGRSGRPITATSSTQVVDAVMQRPEGTRLMVLSPVVRGKKGFHRDVLEDLSQQGWNRARVNGALLDLRDVLKDPGENPLKLGRYEKHTIEAVIDRVVLGPDTRQRLAESVEAAIRIAKGLVVIAVEADGSWVDHSYSTNFADPEHPDISLEELAPRTFSFNSPFGACRECNGLGTLLELDEHLVVPDEQKSLGGGAVEAYAKNMNVRAWFTRAMRKFCKAYKIDDGIPFSLLTADQRRLVLYGATKEEAKKAGRAWEGVIPELTNWWGSTENTGVKEWLGQFMSNKPCGGCKGDRLRIEALHVLVESSHAVDLERFGSGSVIGRPRTDGTVINIAELSKLTITEALAYVRGLKLTQEQRIIAEPILKRSTTGFGFLRVSGLGISR